MDTQKIYQDLLTDAEAVRDSLVAQKRQKNDEIQRLRDALEQSVAELNFISGQVEQANNHVIAMTTKRDAMNVKDSVDVKQIFETWPENS